MAAGADGGACVIDTCEEGLPEAFDVVESKKKNQSTFQWLRA